MLKQTAGIQVSMAPMAPVAEIPPCRSFSLSGGHLLPRLSICSTRTSSCWRHCAAALRSACCWTAAPAAAASPPCRLPCWRRAHCCGLPPQPHLQAATACWPHTPSRKRRRDRWQQRWIRWARAARVWSQQCAWLKAAALLQCHSVSCRSLHCPCLNAPAPAPPPCTCAGGPGGCAGPAGAQQEGCCAAPQPHLQALQ